MYGAGYVASVAAVNSVPRSIVRPVWPGNEGPAASEASRISPIGIPDDMAALNACYQCIG